MPAWWSGNPLLGHFLRHISAPTVVEPSPLMLPSESAPVADPFRHLTQLHVADQEKCAVETGQELKRPWWENKCVLECWRTLQAARLCGVRSARKAWLSWANAWTPHKRIGHISHGMRHAD